LLSGPSARQKERFSGGAEHATLSSCDVYAKLYDCRKLGRVGVRELHCVAFRHDQGVSRANGSNRQDARASAFSATTETGEVLATIAQNTQGSDIERPPA
jgi:hypothetical protein